MEEYRVETQNTPASYQSGGAGVISLVSKSGGNQFHGDAFGVFRPDILAANDYFNKQSQLRTARPISRLLSPLSGRRLDQRAHPAQEALLLWRLRGHAAGDVRRLQHLYCSHHRGTDRRLFADSFTIYDPTLPDNPDGTRQAFAGNKIANPNPIALKFLSEFPKCNFPSASTCDAATDAMLSNNFYVPGLDPTTQQKFDVRMDYDKSEKQRIFGRFSFDRLFTSGVNAFNNPWDLNYAQNVTNGRNFCSATTLP